MEWCVVKTGFPQFDAQHARGLVTVISLAGGTPVLLEEFGATYYLSTPAKTVNFRDITLGEVLPLPSAAELN